MCKHIFHVPDIYIYTSKSHYIYIYTYKEKSEERENERYTYQLKYIRKKITYINYLISETHNNDTKTEILCPISETNVRVQ